MYSSYRNISKSTVGKLNVTRNTWCTDNSFLGLHVTQTCVEPILAISSGLENTNIDLIYTLVIVWVSLKTWNQTKNNETWIAHKCGCKISSESFVRRAFIPKLKVWMKEQNMHAHNISRQILVHLVLRSIDFDLVMKSLILSGFQGHRPYW